MATGICCTDMEASDQVSQTSKVRHRGNHLTHLRDRSSQALASCSFLWLVAGGGGAEEREEAKEKQEEGGKEKAKWVEHLNQEGVDFHDQVYNLMRKGAGVLERMETEYRVHVTPSRWKPNLFKTK